MLREIKAEGVGLIDKYQLEFAPRLTLVTGDNGLGKTFVLDLACFGLTAQWPAEPARPYSLDSHPKFVSEVGGTIGRPGIVKAYYDLVNERWVLDQKPDHQPGFVIYASAEGRYMVWDWIKTPYPDPEGDSAPAYSTGYRPGYLPTSYHFQPNEAWNECKLGDKTWCNGLIRDWTAWHNDRRENEQLAFKALSSVLTTISSPEAPMEPAEPRRTSALDAREIPFIKFPYGTIPVTLVSSAVKRILELSYLMIWTWLEQRNAAQLRGEVIGRELVLIIDEVELHLHPKWQRAILPALLKVMDILYESYEGKPRTTESGPLIQVIATTHSPFVLASIETAFDENTDKLYHFNHDELTNHISLEQLPWIKHGSADGWLLSEVFDLKQARSYEAERAIVAANAFMRRDFFELPEGLKTKDEIHAELLRVLPGQDVFWPRWLVTAEKLD